MPTVGGAGAPVVDATTAVYGKVLLSEDQGETAGEVVTADDTRFDRVQTVFTAFTSILTNITAAFQETMSDRRVKLDLRGQKRWRAVFSRIAAGAAGFRYEIQYSLDNSTWKEGDGSANGSDCLGALSVAGDATGLVDTGWVDIPVEAQVNNVYLRCVTITGNSTADPQAVPHVLLSGTAA